MPDEAAQARRDWNRGQERLRALLMRAREYAEALPLFLEQHRAVHALRLVRGGYWSFQDQLLTGLSDDAWRTIPQKMTHSIAWLIWHITRIEDATMNLLLAGTPQVFDHGGWEPRLSSPFRDAGNEMKAEEIQELSARVDLQALIDYRLAVGKRTRSIASHVRPEVWGLRPRPDRLNSLMKEGALRKEARYLLDYWGGYPSANLLLMPATRHPFLHLNEARRVRLKLLSE